LTVRKSGTLATLFNIDIAIARCGKIPVGPICRQVSENDDSTGAASTWRLAVYGGELHHPLRSKDVGLNGDEKVNAAGH
jgi:hypothetical protein